MFESGLSYSTITTARSAISTLIHLTSGVDMSTNPLVSRLCKGIYNAHPPKPRYMDTWPVEQLLDHLRRLAPSTALSLLQLSRKLATLMLLLLGQRTQGLHLLDIRNIKVQSSILTITYGDHLKQSRPGYTIESNSIAAYPPDPELCVVTLCKLYLACTATLRQSQQLFISSRLPHAPASKDTLSHWVKDSMSMAGIDVQLYKPHSVRVAATSAAHKQEVPLTTILSKAGWTQQSTFRKFYNKPVSNPADFSTRILNTVGPAKLGDAHTRTQP